MKKDQTIVLFSVLFFLCSALSCGSSGSSNVNENGNKAANNKNVSNSPKPVAAADCPTGTLGVKEFKDKGKDYEGCLLSVQGKLWAITNDVATLIDTSDRTDYNGALYIGGNFAGGKYTDIALKISKMKIDQQLDRLPVVTFTGTVETANGFTGLKNGNLSNVQ
jgi:hypothetical protein